MGRKGTLSLCNFGRPYIRDGLDPQGRIWFRTSSGNRVLNLEISVKHKRKSQLGKTYRHLLSMVKSDISIITYLSILKLIRSAASRQNDVVKVRHATKLSNLKSHPPIDVSVLDTNKIVVNLSNIKFSDTEVNILSRGLSYSIPPQHLDSLDVRTSFECFYRQFCNSMPGNCVSRLKQRLKGLCYTYIYRYQSHMFHNLSKEEFQAFQRLKKRDDIVFCKPDKGNGVVILNKTDYNRKIQALINDKSKFKQLKEDPTEKRELCLQKYLRYLKNLGAFSEEVLNQIRPCGSNPSRIYGLPKLHKDNVPLRPIVSGIGSYTHKLAKYLSNILKPLTINKYSVKDSFTFTQEILMLNSVPYMCSFDVASLFTSIPVNETIEICLDLLYKDSELVNNLTRAQFKKLLVFCVKENHFTFNEQYFDQIDGVAMGSPLGPVLANIFMSHFEDKALDKYDGNLPLFYKRYVDDTFVVFNDSEDCELFFEYFNTQHRNIKFTLEHETSDCISFLDVLVTRNEEGTIETSMYRKETFSGLYMKFDSFVPHHFKKNLISGLLNRAWKICSSYELFYRGLNIIKEILMSNGFPVRFLNRHIRNFLDTKHINISKSYVYGPEKRPIFLSLPYCGENSVKLSRQLNRLLAKLAPWAKLNIVFKPVARLNVISKLKSVIPKLNRSNVVYKINCQDCNEFYIGLTTRRLHKRLNEHKKRTYCALYKHAETGHVLDFVNPEIIGNDQIKLRLQVKETLQIYQHSANKSLNINIDSFECKLW